MRRRGRAPAPLALRFWAKVQKTETCWLWTACIHEGPRIIGGGGYGYIKVGERLKRAHIVAWYLEHGEWPTLLVLHHCDNRRCVRPSHLFLGTHADNAADREAKHRTSRGERHGAKLTAERVVRIRELRAEGWKLRELAQEFGISIGYVPAVVAGRKWAHV